MGETVPVRFGISSDGSVFDGFSVELLLTRNTLTPQQRHAIEQLVQLLRKFPENDLSALPYSGYVVLTEWILQNGKEAQWIRELQDRCQKLEQEVASLKNEYKKG